METTNPSFDLALRLATASLIGLAVGLEREWSGQSSGPRARFAGLRTFFLIGLLGGLAGTLIDSAHVEAGVMLLVIGGAFVVVAYATAMRRETADFDGTTEIAAIVVLGLGVLAAFGELMIAAGAGATVVLMLGEKARLHWLVSKIAKAELEAALQFAVLALVVLPLLPSGPFAGVLDIRPRMLWAVVLLFSGLNFAGYVARRVWGANRGYGIMGLLGGLVSSTVVTLQFSRNSRTHPALGGALALGAIGASTALFLRVVVVSAVINPDVALALIPFLLLPAIVGAGWFFLASRRTETEAPAESPDENQSPLRLLSSIKMAIVFQVALSLVAVIRSRWGESGVYVGAGALGLTSVDALTLSMSRDNIAAQIGAQAIALGALVNTVLKLGIAIVIGGAPFRRRVIPGLLALSAASGLALWLWWGA